MRTIKDVVDDWAIPIMEGSGNGWFPIEGRAEAILQLVLVLKADGYTRETIQPARNHVVRHCVNAKSKKRAAWIGIVNKEFDRAVWAVFGEKLPDVEAVDTTEKVEAGRRMLEAAKTDAKERAVVEREARAEADAEQKATRYRQYVPDPAKLKEIAQRFKFGPGGDDEEIL